MPFEPLRQERPEFRPEAVSLLMGRSLAGAGRTGDARRELEDAVARFGTFEAMAEYAILCYALGDTATSTRLHTQMQKIRSRWTSLTLELNERVVRRVDAARALATERS